MPRLQCQPFFQLVPSQLDLVLIVIDSGAVVIQHGGIGGIQLERTIEFGQRFVVHSVAPQRHPGHHVDVPVVGRGGQQIGIDMPRRPFAARKSM